MELTLYRNDGTPFTEFKIKQFTHTDQEMGDTTISFDLKLPYLIENDEWIKSYVTYKQQIYRIHYPPTRVKDLSGIEYTYSIIMSPAKEILKQWYFLDYVSAFSDIMYTGLAMTHFFGDIEEFASRLLANLHSREASQWIVNVDLAEDDPRRGKFEEFSFDKVYIWDALAEMYTKLNIPYKIFGKRIDIGDFSQEITGHNFKYGMSNGLYSLNRSPINEATYNRIIPIGGERNLPLNYYRDVVGISSALRTPFLMPKIFTDSPVGTKWWYDIEAGVGTTITPREVFVQYEDIFPSIKNVIFNSQAIDRLKGVGEIGTDEIGEDGVVQDSFFPITAHAFGFNLMSCLASREEMFFEMTSGACAGCRFKVIEVNGEPLNKYEYINNIIIKPQLVSEIAITNKAGQYSDTILGNYLNLRINDIKMSQVKFSPASFIDNIEPLHDITVTLDTLFINEQTNEEIVLSTYSILVPSESRVNLSTAIPDLILVPEDEYADLTVGIWRLVTKVSATRADDVEEYAFGKSYIYAEFNPLEPTIKNVPKIKQANPIIPSTFDNTILLQKDLDTFGILMPNSAQKPLAGDSFIITGIELPESYITAAQLAVENRAKSELEEKYGVEKYNYSLELDSLYIQNNNTIEAKLLCGNTMEIDDLEEKLRITQCSTKYLPSKLFPEYTVTLSNTTKPLGGAINAINRKITTLSNQSNAFRIGTNTNSRVMVSSLDRVEARSYNATNSLGQPEDMSGYVKSSGGTFTGKVKIKKVIPETLVIPQGDPDLIEGEFGLTLKDTGFSGVTPPENMIENMSDLNDVSFSTLSDQQAVVFDNSIGKFTNKTISLSGHVHDDRYYTESEIDSMLSGVTIDAYTKSEADGKFHPKYGLDNEIPLDLFADKFDSKTLLIPQDSPEVETGEFALTLTDAGFSGEAPPSGVIENLSDLGDVALSSPTNMEVLMFNGTVWMNSIIDAINSWDDILDKPSTFTPSSHNHDDLYYTETEIGNILGGSTAMTGYNKANWDTAHQWGNHASAGYLSSLPSHDHDDRYYTESEIDTALGYKAALAGSSSQDFSAKILSVATRVDTPALRLNGYDITIE